MPDFSSNACAGLSSEDREALWQAARILADTERFIGRIVQIVGRGTSWVGGKAAGIADKSFGPEWREALHRMLEETLRKAMDAATLGLDAQDQEEPWKWFNKAVTFSTGTVTGFFGLGGAALDIPITTLLILRSIADIARSKGEDPDLEETKRACLQVFGFGNPTSADGEPEVAYWTNRAAIATLSMEVLIEQMAGRLGVVFSEKLVAQAVPIAGALAAGALNYVFMDYYQQLATVHFTIRQLERKCGDDGGVRACFDNLVFQAKSRRGSAENDSAD